MAKTPDAKRRASFGRADRVKRDVQQDRPRTARPNTPAPSKQPVRSKPASPKPAAMADRRPTPLDQAKNRAVSAYQATERKRLQRMQEQTQAAFNRQADRRRDDARRADQAKRQETLKASLKCADELRRQQAKRADDRKREARRTEFNRKADDQRLAQRKDADQKRQQMLKEAARKAAAEVERDQKRRAADQQAQHRRETDAVRNRHRGERDSFRSNETAALERHLGAVRRLDAAEQRELHSFDVRRNSLTGRIGGLVPGSGRKADEQRQGIRDRYEAERMTKHRDLEALKERQFKNDQDTRIRHAMERKEMMSAHRDDRDRFQHQQQTDRPRLVEERQNAIVAVKEREQVQEREQAQDRGQAKAPAAVLAPAFERVRGPA